MYNNEAKTLAHNGVDTHFFLTLVLKLFKWAEIIFR